MKSIKILSVGGSIVAPDSPDTDFISRFKNAVIKYLEEYKESRLVFIVGGAALQGSTKKPIEN